MADKREILARAICAHECAAPDPEAPIYISMRPAKAWEARLPQADASIATLRSFGFALVPLGMPEPVGSVLEGLLNEHDPDAIRAAYAKIIAKAERPTPKAAE